MREPPFLRLDTVLSFLPVAAAFGVSKVARSRRGFVAAYKLAGGRPSRLPLEWRKKRAGFIARHVAQMKKRREPLFTGRSLPTRRHLALIMWAYSPAGLSRPRKRK